MENQLLGLFQGFIIFLVIIPLQVPLQWDNISRNYPIAMELVNHKNERKSFQRFIDNNIKAKSNNDSLYDNTLNRKKIYIFDVMFLFIKNVGKS